MHFYQTAKYLPGTAHPLLRLGECMALTANELLAFEAMISDVRSIGPRRDIIHEGRTCNEIFFVLDGILMRYRVSRDGRRQIVNLIVPGDVAGIFGCFFDCAPYSTRTLAHSVVAAMPLSRLFGLFETQPRLAAKIFWLFSCDAAIHAEHVVVVAHRSALERIAHFLLELMTRLQVVGLADGRSFCIPLSQEIIGDALGLSLAYVSRVLRQLADDGLVVIKDQQVVINDLDALSALADFEPSYLKPMPISQHIHQAVEGPPPSSPIKASSLTASR